MSGNGESDRRPAIDITGGGIAHISNLNVGDRRVRFGGNTDLFLENSATGSIELEGNRAYLNQVNISGQGHEALKMTNANADFHNISIQPGHQYGISAENSNFLIHKSVVNAMKYDFRLRAGVVADIYDVKADDVIDYARGESRAVQGGILNESIVTTDSRLRCEKYASKSGRLKRAVELFFLLKELASLLP